MDLGSSKSESLTSDSVGIDSPRALTPDRTSSRNTPIHDTDKPSYHDTTNAVMEQSHMTSSIEEENSHNSSHINYDKADISNREEDGATVRTQMASATQVNDPEEAPVNDSLLESPDEDEEDIAPIPKRKRISTMNGVDDFSTKRPYEHASKRPKPDQLRGVIIGVWNESSEVNFEDKHIVHAFLDNKDRLRTRMYGQTRAGKIVIGNMPIGAGACWVTSEKVTLDSHLAPLTSAQLKEYVKLRSEDESDKSPEDREQADLRTVERAKAATAEYEKNPPRPVAHRPYKRRESGRVPSPLPSPNPVPSTSTFRTITSATPKNTIPNDAVASADSPMTAAATPRSSPVPDLNRMGVLLGHWLLSDSIEDADKHAVFGVISGNGCFRIKVAKVTRDGRPMEGNYPIGTGSMWIHWEKLGLEPRLHGMSRKEIKEYVAIREPQLEIAETAEEAQINDANAIMEAKKNVASGKSTPRIKSTVEYEPEVELRHSARAEHKSTAKQQAEYDAEFDRGRHTKTAAKEQPNEKKRKDDTSGDKESYKTELKHNIKKLDRIWCAQEKGGANGFAQLVQPVAQPPAASPPSDEVKYHGGNKYERKQQGPLKGKLVSAGQILSIDGEDYVEYRVLSKLSF